MIIVHVWSSAWHKGSLFGHAAIEIGSVYVSFWPGKEHVIKPLTWSGYNTKSKVEDLSHYRAAGQNHWFRTIPNNLGGPGLDEEKMLTRWNEIQLQNPDYTTKFQCSAVVYSILKAGDSESFIKTQHIYSQSPSDVKDYTESLIAHLGIARQNFSLIDIG